MRSTRTLLNAVTTAAGKSILKPRSQWDTLSSAFATTLSILSSQSDRDHFVETVNKGIINPSIIGQADFGFFMTLALHHDLEKFKSYDFDVEEFVETAEPALERFQEVLYSLDNEVLPEFANEVSEMAKKQDGEVPPSVTNVQDLAEAMDTMQDIEKTLGEQAVWKEKAEEDPDSLYGQLHAMVSEQLLDSCERQFKQSVLHCYMNQQPRMNYTLNSGAIQNIALLSARVHEVIPDENEEDLKTMHDNDSDLVDDSLNGGIEKKFPIVAQIEVIYSIEQKFKQQKIEINNADSSADSDEKENTLDTAWVAVFEGMLSDGTDGSTDSLRWKLVENRPAWEFPGLSMTR